MRERDEQSQTRENYFEVRAHLLYVPAFNIMKDFHYNDRVRSLGAATPTTSSLKNSWSRKSLNFSHKNNTHKHISLPRPHLYNFPIQVKGRDTVGQQINVTCEVQQLLGNNRVKAVAMSATDGLTKGMEVIDTGAALSVPVGGATLGRIFNVLREPVDNLGPVDTRSTSPMLQPQVAKSRHRGAKSSRRCELLGKISLLSL